MLDKNIKMFDIYNTIDKYFNDDKKYDINCVFSDDNSSNLIFRIRWNIDGNVDDNDLKHNNIVIDKSSLNMLKGSNVDFTKELIGSSFKISNPKTKSSCGCGISFSF